VPPKIELKALAQYFVGDFAYTSLPRRPGIGNKNINTTKMGSYLV